MHPLVRAVAAHDRWWPGLGVSEAGDGWLTVTHAPPRPGARGTARRARLPVGPLRRGVVLDLRVTNVRPGDRGLHLACRGAFDGRVEWYYLDEPDGTVVHHVLDATTRPRGAARRLATYRASVRAGLHALKDMLEGQRWPGDEPDPALLAHQREAAKALLPPAEGTGGS